MCIIKRTLHYITFNNSACRVGMTCVIHIPTILQLIPMFSLNYPIILLFTHAHTALVYHSLLYVCKAMKLCVKNPVQSQHVYFSILERDLEGVSFICALTCIITLLTISNL